MAEEPEQVTTDEEQIEESQEDSTVSVPESEWNETREALSRLTRTNRRLESDLGRLKSDKESAVKAERERKATEEGEWKLLAEQRAEELEAKEREIEALRSDQMESDRKRIVEAVAKRLNFIDPDDAHRFVGTDVSDESDVERELRSVKRAKPYLVEDQRRSGAPAGGNGAQTSAEEEHRELISGLLGGGR